MPLLLIDSRGSGIFFAMRTAGELILADGSKYPGKSFGAEKSMAGEVVFTTGMVGYPESLTDPSFAGQILVMTYPLIGNYGVPAADGWESDRIWVSGLVVSSYVETPSHVSSQQTLGNWLEKQGIPAIEVRDTRALTQKLREVGTMLGKLEIGSKRASDYDPNNDNLVAKVSTTKVTEMGGGRKKVVLIDCGAKASIAQELVKRGVRVVRVPWNYDFIDRGLVYDGVVVSNGPGDPKMVVKTVEVVKKLLKSQEPVLGICLGNQIMALAAGGDTYKLKYGHRGQNQPCIEISTERCYMTSQNHGFAVGKVPNGFRAWFANANDETNEGIIHEQKPFFSVQFHPEANPGPEDTGFIFDKFIGEL